MPTLRSYEKLRAHSDCLQDCWDGKHWPSAQFIALHVKISHLLESLLRPVCRYWALLVKSWQAGSLVLHAWDRSQQKCQKALELITFVPHLISGDITRPRYALMQWCHVQSEQCLQNIVWRVFRCNAPELRTCVCFFLGSADYHLPIRPNGTDGCGEFAGSSGGEALHFCTNVTAAPWIFLQWFFSKLGLFKLINIAGFMWGLMKFAYRLYDYVVLY